MPALSGSKSKLQKDQPSQPIKRPNTTALGYKNTQIGPNRPFTGVNTVGGMTYSGAGINMNGFRARTAHHS